MRLRAERSTHTPVPEAALVMEQPAMVTRQCVACSNANVDGHTSSAYFDRADLHRSLVPTDADEER